LGENKKGGFFVLKDTIFKDATNTYGFY